MSKADEDGETQGDNSELGSEALKNVGMLEQEGDLSWCIGQCCCSNKQPQIFRSYDRKDVFLTTLLGPLLWPCSAHLLIPGYRLKQQLLLPLKAEEEREGSCFYSAPRVCAHCDLSPWIHVPLAKRYPMDKPKVSGAGV